MKRTWKALIILALITGIFAVPFLGSAAQVHRVAPGENLYLIANQYDISLQELLRMNAYLRQPDRIHPGQLLIVPRPSVQEPEIKVPDSQVPDPEQPERDLGIPDVTPTPAPPLDQPRQPSISQLVNMFSGRFFLKGPAHDNRIAITFDDGPDEVYTPQVLDVLKEYNVPATFFLIGQEVDKHPQVTGRIAAEGHLIGSHSWSHPDFRRLTGHDITVEMKRTRDALVKATGLRPYLMRPPYGAVNTEVLNQLVGLDYYVVNWSVDSVDWRDQEVDPILVNTLKDVREGAIMLFHSAGGGSCRQATVDALPELIETLRMQGYTFVTVDELLNIPRYR